MLHLRARARVEFLCRLDRASWYPPRAPNYGGPYDAPDILADTSRVLRPLFAPDCLGQLSPISPPGPATPRFASYIRQPQWCSRQAMMKSRRRRAFGKASLHVWWSRFSAEMSFGQSTRVCDGPSLRLRNPGSRRS